MVLDRSAARTWFSIRARIGWTPRTTDVFRSS